MQSLSKHEFDARARKELLEVYDNTPRCEGLIFVMQVSIPHERASDMKLRVGYIQDSDNEKTYVWANVCHNADVFFYKDNTRLPAAALKHVSFQEPMRTLTGQLKDPRARRLHTYIYFLFEAKGGYGTFVEGKNLRFEYFKAGCKRIADARRNVFYGFAQELRIDFLGEDDEGYESDNGAVPVQQIAGMKRGHDGYGDTGNLPTHHSFDALVFS